jgi:PAS domain S-box-containing protein
MKKLNQNKKLLIESGGLLFLVPVLSVIGLALVMSLTFWLIYESEIRQQKATILQDVENSAQALRLKLRRNEFALNAIARDLGRRKINQSGFQRYAENFFATSPEVLLLTWVNLQGSKLASFSSFYDPNDSILLPPVTSVKRLNQEQNLKAFQKTIDSRKPTYTQPFSGDDQIRELLIDFHTPVMSKGKPEGIIIATYSVPAMLQTAIPVGIANRVNFGLSYINGPTLSLSPDRPFHSVQFESIGSKVSLYGFTRAPAQSNLSAAVNPLIFALMAIALISHIMLIRHAKRRKDTEKALSKEIAFRRAMEDSMPTGMRVIDSEGKISYVNSAFCKLVGLEEDELIDAKPPYPYWPPEEIQKLKAFSKKLLNGDLSDLGEQVIVMHNSGRRIITRMYTSPFKDSFGKQTGWMTSITDITEPTRYRNELAHAQNRFTTVLQSLDTAVSFAAPSPSNDLLFAN